MSSERVQSLFDGVEIAYHSIYTQPLPEMSNRALVDPVLFRVFYATGMRQSEVLNLQLRDVDPVGATLEVRDTRRLAASLEIYIAATHTDPEPARHLFHAGDPDELADNSRAARTSIRCGTVSPRRTCGAGPPTARTWR